MGFFLGGHACTGRKGEEKGQLSMWEQEWFRKALGSGDAGVGEGCSAGARARAGDRGQRQLKKELEDVAEVSEGTTDPFQCVSQEVACAKFVTKRDFSRRQQALKNIVQEIRRCWVFLHIGSISCLGSSNGVDEGKGF